MFLCWKVRGMTSQLHEASEELLCLSAEQLSQHTCCDLLRDVLDGSPHQLLHCPASSTAFAEICHTKGISKLKSCISIAYQGGSFSFEAERPRIHRAWQQGNKKAFILPSPSLSWAAHSQHGEFPRLWVPTPAPPAIPGTCRLWGPPQASPRHAGPPCRGGVAPEETATHLAQASLCPEGHSKCSERKRDQTLPSGSVPAAGKTVLM